MSIEAAARVLSPLYTFPIAGSLYHRHSSLSDTQPDHVIRIHKAHNGGRMEERNGGSRVILGTGDDPAPWLRGMRPSRPVELGVHSQMHLAFAALVLA